MNNEEISSQIPYYGQGTFADVNTRIRDMEEKTRILKDRVLIMGKNLVEEREDARKKKDWKKADALRDKLISKGLVLEDTPQGPIWKRK